MDRIDIVYDNGPTGHMNIQDLRYLPTVAELERFGRAAKACGISQPTLSVLMWYSRTGPTCFDPSPRHPYNHLEPRPPRPARNPPEIRSLNTENNLEI